TGPDEEALAPHPNGGRTKLTVPTPMGGPMSSAEHAEESSSEAAELDLLIDRFEKAWQLGRQPNINDYIPVECSQRRVALRELSRVDLEFRLKAGEDARLESYLTSFPELADDRDAVLGLIVTEFDLRRRRHSAPSLEEYQCRFPQLADHLPTCLKAGTKR